jgi:FkbM family methyltransferase
LNKPRLKDEDHKKLQAMARFQAFQVEFLGNPMEGCDAASFLSQNAEIFGREIYKFSAPDKSPFILDIGSNIGMSMIYFKYLFEGARIIGFEPDPMIFDILVKNLRSFDITDSEIHNFACSDKECNLSFKSNNADGGKITNEYCETGLLTVDCVLASDFINEDVDFIKIDAEGSEYKILKDLEPKLPQVKQIFVEYHSFSVAESNLGPILNILEKNNFFYSIEQNNRKINSPFYETFENLKKEKNFLNIFCFNKDFFS